MNTDTQKTGKYLINCRNGLDDLEQATISFVLAATASKTAEARIFMTAGASDLCVKGGADGLVEEGMEPVDNLINQFVEQGGKIWLCPICAKVRGITEDDLREGVAIVGAPAAMEFLESGGKLLA